LSLEVSPRLQAVYRGKVDTVLVQILRRLTLEILKMKMDGAYLKHIDQKQ
jgi:hypothetical protein